MRASAMTDEAEAGIQATATIPAARVEIEVRGGGRREAADRADLRAGLLRTPRHIPSRFFYDERGSALFERITELPEYYQTRTERALLERVADRVAAATRAEALVELGSGSARKTRLLIEALRRAGSLRLYVPFDVAEGTVRQAGAELTAEYPGLAVHGVVGDLVADLGPIPGLGGPGGHRLAIFLGGTIGNFRPEEARSFLARLAEELAPGDAFLLGVDLIKPVPRLEAAYDDSAGVTAEFNRNILRVVNRLTGGDFDPAAFHHRAFYDPVNRWVDIRLVALWPQRVRLPGISLDFELAEGEEIRTEISAKYDRESAEKLLRDAGFEPAEWFTDDEALFGLSLAYRPRSDEVDAT